MGEHWKKDPAWKKLEQKNRTFCPIAKGLCKYKDCAFWSYVESINQAHCIIHAYLDKMVNSD